LSNNVSETKEGRYNPFGELIKEKEERHKRLDDLINERIKQPGVEFPKPGQQEHLLIVRLNIVDKGVIRVGLDDPIDTPEKRKQNLRKSVHDGLINLLTFLDSLHTGKKQIDQLTKGGGIKRASIGYIVNPEEFNFSATIGFGIGFFDKLGIPTNKRPKLLKSMPNHIGLGDIAPYSLEQSDLIIQLGSRVDFINRWVLENNFQPTNEDEKEIHDIVSAIRDWAMITDVHVGFQRLDGRNLMGFNDGISNPNPGAGEEFDRFVWLKEEDNELKEFINGTYMVFQKIAHDLDQWRSLKVEQQEEWVGRDKTTGLLLGTPEVTEEFKKNVKKGDKQALEKLATLMKEQSNPLEPFYDENKKEYKSIRDSTPIWSHVRKANPRDFTENRKEDRIIFRRGYLYTESGINDKINSGLLFVCFQRDIEHKFEFIKKAWFGSNRFPVPGRGAFNELQIKERRKRGRFTEEQLTSIENKPEIREFLGLEEEEDFKEALKEAKEANTQNTGREGLSGPSELGVIPTGQFLAIVPFGGGYYFVPPIPNKKFEEIAKPFFNFPDALPQ
jgi:Dyp-type peroxidase family